MGEDGIGQRFREALAQLGIALGGEVDAIMRPSTLLPGGEQRCAVYVGVGTNLLLDSRVDRLERRRATGLSGNHGVIEESQCDGGGVCTARSGMNSPQVLNQAIHNPLWRRRKVRQKVVGPEKDEADVNVASSELLLQWP